MCCYVKNFCFCRVGLVESKIRILVGNLEKIPQIRLARANPTMFPVDTDRYGKNWYIWMRPSKDVLFIFLIWMILTVRYYNLCTYCLVLLVSLTVTHSPLSVTCTAWWLVDWPIAIKKHVSNSMHSDQPFQKLIYAIRFSQLSISFAVFDMFVCIFYVFACGCWRNPAFGCQK